MKGKKIIPNNNTLKRTGKTFGLVQHDLTTVQKYFDKVILINQRIIAFGDNSTIFTQENLSRCYGSQLSILHKILEL